MKKLFTIKNNGIFRVEVEGSVYSTFIRSENKYTFFDNEGNLLENYKRPPIQDDKIYIEIDDPDFYEEIDEGFYKYTTHEVTYDIDGEYGLFGIKHNDGKKLTEEIYCQIGKFCNGLCSVSVEDGKWGCINTQGNLVIPYNFYEEMFFNKYGVAVGNNTLIDVSGHPIADTSLNSIDSCSEDDRYFVFSFLNDKQSDSIDEFGTAEDITVDIYDTKNREYVIKGVPEGCLDVYMFDGEPEVILAAVNFIGQYDRISITKKGIIICKKDELITIYDYYR